MPFKAGDIDFFLEKNVNVRNGLSNVQILTREMEWFCSKCGWSVIKTNNSQHYNGLNSVKMIHSVITFYIQNIKLKLQFIVLIPGVTPAECIRFFDFDHNRIALQLYRGSEKKRRQLVLYATESMPSLYCNKLTITTECHKSWELVHQICVRKQKTNKIEYEERQAMLKPLLTEVCFEAVTAVNLKSAFTKHTNPFYISQTIRAVKVIN